MSLMALSCLELYTFFTSLCVQLPRMCPIESASLHRGQCVSRAIPCPSIVSRAIPCQRVPYRAFRALFFSVKVTLELVKKALLASGSVCG
jgi:hypothetical protein